MRDFPKPVVISSKCIEFEACRYNGAVIPSEVVKLLEPHVEFRPVCPEVEIGLGVPRHPIRIIRKGSDLRLVQPETGKDVTRFVEKYLDGVKDTDGFVLKFRSPSCGIKDTKIYSGTEKGASSTRGGGFFGGAVIRRFPGLAVEDAAVTMGDSRISGFASTSLPSSSCLPRSGESRQGEICGLWWSFIQRTSSCLWPIARSN